MNFKSVDKSMMLYTKFIKTIDKVVDLEEKFSDFKPFLKKEFSQLSDAQKAKLETQCQKNEQLVWVLRHLMIHHRNKSTYIRS